MTALTPPPGRNGVLIAARHPFDDGGALSEALPEPCRIVRAYFGAVRVYGIYMPNLLKKVPYWQALIAAFAADTLAPGAFALGAFHTCRPHADEAGHVHPPPHSLPARHA